jgi:hypothetical protein
MPWGIRSDKCNTMLLNLYRTTIPESIKDTPSQVQSSALTRAEASPPGLLNRLPLRVLLELVTPQRGPRDLTDHIISSCKGGYEVSGCLTCSSYS